MILNDCLVAEKETSAASRYHIVADEKEMGMYKSSGLIVATGTGSTGWLYNARRISNAKISALKQRASTVYESRHYNALLARDMSKSSTFAPDEHKMYFFVREGFSFTTLVTEGFCSKLVVTSEMLNGEVCIDGWANHPFGTGD